jgi:hypothetical protein
MSLLVFLKLQFGHLGEKKNLHRKKLKISNPIDKKILITFMGESKI